MRWNLLALTCAGMLLAGGLAAPSASDPHHLDLTGSTHREATRAPVKYDARVIHVQDGDTVVVRLRSGARRYVRILGIDTPETIQGQHECGGSAASRLTKHLLRRGTRVLLRADPAQPRIDRYHRLLRYVRRASDLLDLGRAQLRRGLAEVYVYRNGRFEKRTEYRRLQRAARQADRGIWGRC